MLLLLQFVLPFHFFLAKFLLCFVFYFASIHVFRYHNCTVAPDFLFNSLTANIPNYANSKIGTKCVITRSSRSQIFFKIGVLKDFANFTGKHLCCSLFLIKLQARPAALLKRNSKTGVFP